MMDIAFEEIGVCVQEDLLKGLVDIDAVRFLNPLLLLFIALVDRLSAFSSLFTNFIKIFAAMLTNGFEIKYTVLDKKTTDYFL